MNVNDPEVFTDPDLDRRIRRSLDAVAATVTEAPVAETPSTPRASYAKRRRRRLALGWGLVLIPLAAFAYVLGPEFVDQIPPKNHFVHGREAGEEYWLVPSFHNDVCGRSFDGVELVMAHANKVGDEWKTGGVAYGEHRPASSGEPQCFTVDESAWLSDPSRVAKLHQRVGKNETGPWITVLAVHPSVAAIRVGERMLPTTPDPKRPGGPRYVVFTVLETGTITEIQWTLLDAANQPIPNGTQTARLKTWEEGTPHE